MYKMILTLNSYQKKYSLFDKRVYDETTKLIEIRYWTEMYTYIQIYRYKPWLYCPWNNCLTFHIFTSADYDGQSNTSSAFSYFTGDSDCPLTTANFCLTSYSLTDSPLIYFYHFSSVQTLYEDVLENSTRCVPVLGV